MINMKELRNLLISCYVSLLDTGQVNAPFHELD